MVWKRIGAIIALAGSMTQCHAVAQTDNRVCRVVTGELSAWNGTPSLRIRANGQTFGIILSQAHPLPSAAAPVDFEHSAIGRFTVCPIGRAKPNGMIYVWLKDVKKLNLVSPP